MLETILAKMPEKIQFASPRCCAAKNGTASQKIAFSFKN
jgi:hypothetical protein